MRNLQRIRGICWAVCGLLFLGVGSDRSTGAAEHRGVSHAAVSSAVESITGKELKGHAGVLSSNTYEGREAGARGGKAAGLYIISQLKKIDALQPAGVDGSYFQPFGRGYRNILAVLPGSDSRLKREYIIVCAHYDHVGYGTRRNSYGPIGYIHNGADDNASGIAALLELTEAFAGLKQPPKRSLVFVFWDAEEKGLLGSAHWVRRPTVPRKRVRLVLNLDMIGRLRKGAVEIHGSRSGRGLRRLISENNPEESLKLNFQWNLPRESDHNSFINAGIPAVMLHTGKHRDYHRPSDDAHKLNTPGMHHLTRLTFQLAYAAAEADALPPFRKQGPQETETDRQRLVIPVPQQPLRFGVAWNPQRAKKNIIEVTGVERGSPAARAGLHIGDRIVRFQGVPVRSELQFRQLVMSARNPVRITVRRGNDRPPLKLTARLKGNPHRVGVFWNIDDAEPGTVVLRHIVRHSPADLSGLRVGDRVYAVNGKPFDTSDEFRERISAADDKLVLRVERAGFVRTVRLDLSHVLPWKQHGPGAASPRTK